MVPTGHKVSLQKKPRSGQLGPIKYKNEMIRTVNFLSFFFLILTQTNKIYNLRMRIREKRKE
jgi:hypothetical protein